MGESNLGILTFLLVIAQINYDMLCDCEVHVTIESVEILRVEDERLQDPEVPATLPTS